MAIGQNGMPKQYIKKREAEPPVQIADKSSQ